ncbi:2-hydroxy-3-oxopropionate reductase [Salimicrobium flavidum]|uniref:2-hydroxy-3-oxopropionate reductase n=1 Tax=Salimicrobium flavidum TaxID=570947 RepID=A0A1N7KQX1_9BACI|nr:2-hydroxy-3-oxopropionate reductase [Salimicrobium flavidum]SIS63945.1 2-hydroxy-3-oxopropionate reductase [Salimicrobium flavidum]
MRVGFIGLGIMGKPMASNLVNAGYNLTVFDLNKKAMDDVIKLGASEGLHATHVAEESDVIFTMLPKGDHVKSVLFGENGIVEARGSSKIIIDMSSISPVDTRDFNEKLNNHGFSLIDAPVSGGEPRAINGTLSFMVGGNEHDFQNIKSLFDVMGENIVLVGDVGSGTTAKLANQVMVNVNIAAMSEAFILAAKSDIDLEKMYKAVRGGLAGSAVLDAKTPLLLERNFVAGGRIDINAKDLTNVMGTAEELDLDLPLSRQVLEMYQDLISDGKGSDDHGGLIQYYEKLARMEVKNDK